LGATDGARAFAANADDDVAAAAAGRAARFSYGVIAKQAAADAELDAALQ